jgi:hypothetical protein
MIHYPMYEWFELASIAPLTCSKAGELCVIVAVRLVGLNIERRKMGEEWDRKGSKAFRPTAWWKPRG